MCVMTIAMRGTRLGHGGPSRDARQKMEIAFEDEVGKEDEALWREARGRQKASCIVRKSDILTARLTSLSSRER